MNAKSEAQTVPMADIEVLVASLNQKDTSLIESMNVKTDAIIANQANNYDYINVMKDSQRCQMITTPYRGVGKNRNIALFAAKADICLIADDDILYYDNYKEIVSEAFHKLKDADIIIFNIEDCENNGRRVNKKVKRLKWYNLLNYGAVRIAFKRQSIVNNSILFSTAFGGGAVYSAGEDSLFLIEAYRKKLHIYTYPKTILKLQESESTWFKGFDEKYFYDKGKFLAVAFPKLKWLLVPVFLLKECKKSSLSMLSCCKNIYKGAFN